MYWLPCVRSIINGQAITCISIQERLQYPSHASPLVPHKKCPFGASALIWGMLTRYIRAAFINVFLVVLHIDLVPQERATSYSCHLGCLTHGDWSAIRPGNSLHEIGFTRA